MMARILVSLALGLLPAGDRLAAQAPGNQGYEANPDTVEEYERLGEETGSNYELDEGFFDEAADQAAVNAPEVTPPSADEVEQFRAGLEAHWGGNLPALWAYLNRINPAGGRNPEPPADGEVPHWEPDDDYDGFGNLIESAEEERERWRQRVERKLGQLAGR